MTAETLAEHLDMSPEYMFDMLRVNELPPILFYVADVEALKAAWQAKRQARIQALIDWDREDREDH